MSDNRPRVEDCVMDFVDSIANRSTCKRMKVGAAVLSTDRLQILGFGYNGQPMGLPNNGCSGEAGICGCVHAESNALIKSGWTDGGILICTHLPCKMCTSLAINTGVKRVEFKRGYRNKDGLKVLGRAHIDINWCGIDILYNMFENKMMGRHPVTKEVMPLEEIEKSVEILKILGS